MEACDVKKMREVLEWAVSTIDVSQEVLDETEDWKNEVVCWVLELQKKARAALTATPRNCDVGTPKEQHKRFIKFCAGVDECSCCKICNDFSFSGECILTWADLPLGIKNNERERQTCENCGTNRDFCEAENRKRDGVCGNWTVKQEGGNNG